MRAWLLCCFFCNCTAHVRDLGRKVTLMCCPFYLHDLSYSYQLPKLQFLCIHFKGCSLFNVMFCYAFWLTYGSLLPHVPIFTLEQNSFTQYFRLCILHCYLFHTRQMQFGKRVVEEFACVKSNFGITFCLFQFPNHPNLSVYRFLNLQVANARGDTYTQFMNQFFIDIHLNNEISTNMV